MTCEMPPEVRLLIVRHLGGALASAWLKQLNQIDLDDEDPVARPGALSAGTAGPGKKQ